METPKQIVQAIVDLSKTFKTDMEQEKNDKNEEQEDQPKQDENKSQNHVRSQNDPVKQQSPVTPFTEDLLRKDKELNIEQKALLLKKLSRFFLIQLICMNLAVLLILCWTIFDWSIFTSVKDSVLELLMSFMKYYIGAVLVEILGGIIYIVHRVFAKD